MEHIRKATTEDMFRIAEVQVFAKRVNYRSIFHDDIYSFCTTSVRTTVEQMQADPAIIDHMWVYDDGFVKGAVEIDGEEVKTLYVDTFFANCGIGSKLLTFAKERFGVKYLWVLAENRRAMAFYQRHNFHYRGEWELGKETGARLLKLELEE